MGTIHIVNTAGLASTLIPAFADGDQIRCTHTTGEFNFDIPNKIIGETALGAPHLADRAFGATFNPTGGGAGGTQTAATRGIAFAFRDAAGRTSLPSVEVQGTFQAGQIATLSVPDAMIPAGCTHVVAYQGYTTASGTLREAGVAPVVGGGSPTVVSMSYTALVGDDLPGQGAITLAGGGDVRISVNHTLADGIGRTYVNGDITFSEGITQTIQTAHDVGGAQRYGWAKTHSVGVGGRIVVEGTATTGMTTTVVGGGSIYFCKAGSYENGDKGWGVTGLWTAVNGEINDGFGYAYRTDVYTGDYTLNTKFKGCGEFRQDGNGTGNWAISGWHTDHTGTYSHYLSGMNPTGKTRTMTGVFGRFFIGDSGNSQVGIYGATKSADHYSEPVEAPTDAFHPVLTLGNLGAGFGSGPTMDMANLSLVRWEEYAGETALNVYAGSRYRCGHIFDGTLASTGTWDTGNWGAGGAFDGTAATRSNRHCYSRKNNANIAADGTCWMEHYYSLACGAGVGDGYVSEKAGRQYIRRFGVFPDLYMPGGCAHLGQPADGARYLNCFDYRGVPLGEPYMHTYGESMTGKVGQALMYGGNLAYAPYAARWGGYSGTYGKGVLILQETDEDNVLGGITHLGYCAAYGVLLDNEGNPAGYARTDSVKGGIDARPGLITTLLAVTNVLDVDPQFVDPDRSLFTFYVQESGIPLRAGTVSGLAAIKTAYITTGAGVALTAGELADLQADRNDMRQWFIDHWNDGTTLGTHIWSRFQDYMVEGFTPTASEYDLAGQLAQEYIDEGMQPFIGFAAPQVSAPDTRTLEAVGAVPTTAVLGQAVTVTYKAVVAPGGATDTTITGTVQLRMFSAPGYVDRSYVWAEEAFDGATGEVTLSFTAPFTGSFTLRADYYPVGA